MTVVLAGLALGLVLAAGFIAAGDLRQLGLAGLERTLAWVLVGGALVGSLAVALSLPGWLTPWSFFPALAILSAALGWIRRGVLGPDGIHLLPAARGDRWLALLLVVVAVLVSRPFDWSLGGRDPGTYVGTAHQLAERGTPRVSLPGLAELPGEALPTAVANLRPSGARYQGLVPPVGGMYVTDLDEGELLPQGFPLYPALMAYVSWLAGSAAMLWVTGFAALVAVAFVGLIARRLGGALAGAAAVALLGANLVQIWFGRFPSSEAVSEAFLAGGTWALLCATQAHARILYATAGLALGASLLARPDQLALVPVTAVVGAWALRSPAPGRAVLAGALPFAALTALTVVDAALYQRQYLGDLFDWGLPDLSRPLGVAVPGAALVAGAVYVRRRRPRAVRFDPRVVGTAAGVLVGAFGIAAMALGWRGAEWLTYYFTPVGFVLAFAALGYLVHREARRGTLLGLAPLLALAGLTAAVYFRSPMVADDLPWAVRRFLPALVPALSLALAVALADLARLRGLRVGALLTLATLTGWLIWIASPSLDQRLYRGSGALVGRIDAALAPGALVLLGPDVTPHNKFTIPLVLRYGRDALPYVPNEAWTLAQGRGSAWARAEALRRPVYIVTTSPRELALDHRRLAAHVVRRIPFSLPSEQPSYTEPLPVWSTLRGEVTVIRLEPRRTPNSDLSSTSQ